MPISSFDESQIVQEDCAKLPLYGAIYDVLAVSTAFFIFVRKHLRLNDFARLAQR